MLVLKELLILFNLENTMLFKIVLNYTILTSTASIINIKND